MCLSEEKDMTGGFSRFIAKGWPFSSPLLHREKGRRREKGKKKRHTKVNVF